MKTLLRIFLISLFALFLTQNLVDGFKITPNPQTYLVGALALGFIYLFVKPILRIFFFPINLLSLGLLSWLINVAILYLLTLIVPQITVSAWQFPGLTYQGFILPAYHLNQLTTFIVTALTLSLIVNFFSWLCR